MEYYVVVDTYFNGSDYGNIHYNTYPFRNQIDAIHKIANIDETSIFGGCHNYISGLSAPFTRVDVYGLDFDEDNLITVYDVSSYSSPNGRDWSLENTDHHVASIEKIMIDRVIDYYDKLCEMANIYIDINCIDDIITKHNNYLNSKNKNTD